MLLKCHGTNSEKILGPRQGKSSHTPNDDGDDDDDDDHGNDKSEMSQWLARPVFSTVKTVPKRLHSFGQKPAPVHRWGCPTSAETGPAARARNLHFGAKLPPRATYCTSAMEKPHAVYNFRFYWIQNIELLTEN